MGPTELTRPKEVKLMYWVCSFSQNRKTRRREKKTNFISADDFDWRLNLLYSWFLISTIGKSSVQNKLFVQMYFCSNIMCLNQVKIFYENNNLSSFTYIFYSNPRRAANVLERETYCSTTPWEHFVEPMVY